MTMNEFAAQVAAEICNWPAGEQSVIIDIITQKVINCQENKLDEVKKHVTQREAALQALKYKLAS